MRNTKTISRQIVISLDAWRSVRDRLITDLLVRCPIHMPTVIAVDVKEAIQTVSGQLPDTY